MPPIRAPGPGLQLQLRRRAGDALCGQEEVGALLAEVKIELLERHARLNDDLEVPIVQRQDAIHLGHVDADRMAACKVFALRCQRRN